VCGRFVVLKGIFTFWRLGLGYFFSLLDRPIAFHRSFVPFAGVTGALFLSQAIYWQQRTTSEDGFFYKTASDWERETGLTQHEQATARARLRDIGILHETKRGIPCKCYFRINEEYLMQVVENVSLSESAKLVFEKEQGRFSVKCGIGLAESAKPVKRNPRSSNIGIRETNSDITQETTSETTTLSFCANDSVLSVVAFWNDQTDSAVVHVDPALERRIAKSLSSFGIAGVKKAITSYWKYLNDPESYWSKRYTLFEFMLNGDRSGVALFFHATDESFLTKFKEPTRLWKSSSNYDYSIDDLIGGSS